MSYSAPAHSALIIVDVQNDFCPGGNLEVPDGDSIIALINDLKQDFKHCILTQDWHPKDHESFASNHQNAQPFTTTQMPYGTQILWPDHCIQNTKGAAFHKNLNIDNKDLILQKGTNPKIDSYSGFFENDNTTQPLFNDGKTLAQTLKERGITHTIFCGLAYDFCVGWHALDAKEKGFKATIIKNATRAIAMPLENATNSEQAMTAQLKQANVQIIKADTIKQLRQYL
ncbi:MAG: bifunctional nicotinamidase/pyrazinamidase [Alphaproteobacteria bacterium]